MAYKHKEVRALRRSKATQTRHKNGYSEPGKTQPEAIPKSGSRSGTLVVKKKAESRY
jgi:hypothetical protein